jgi:peptidoglycan hydrolase-like protein with peptidoglycan-binding domain
MNLLRRALLLVPVALLCGLLVPAPGEAAPAPVARSAECRRTLAHYPLLDPGDRRPAVRTLQCTINDLGLGPVVVDGYYGPQTKKALTRVVNGREGQPPHPYRLYPLFWSQLYGLQIPEDTVLRQGDHGPLVRILQRSLRAYGITVVVDGDFGPQTRSAVQSYQRHHGDTSPSGIVDEDVMFYLHGGDYY